MRNSFFVCIYDKLFAKFVPEYQPTTSMKTVAATHPIPRKPASPAVWLALTALAALIFAVTIHYTATQTTPQDHRLNMAKSSGRNEPHANSKAREQARQEYEKVKREFELWDKNPKKHRKRKNLFKNSEN